MKKIVFTLIVLILAPTLYASETNRKPAEVFTLTTLLKKAYESNGALRAKQHDFEAEGALIANKATLDDPMLGYSGLKRGNLTQFITVSQKIKFPTKYIFAGNAQSAREDIAKAEYLKEKLNLKKKVISLYFKLYTTQKIIDLTQANMSAVREFARIAEKKYASGSAKQTDTMKAHVELTNLELELLQLKQAENTIQNEIKAVINDSSFPDVILYQKNLETPEPNLNVIKKDIHLLVQALQENSPGLKSQKEKVELAHWEKTLAHTDYLPDFELRYQQRIAGEPMDSKIYSVSFTIPLWFWNKSSAASATTSKKDAEESRYVDMTQKLIAKVRNLENRVQTQYKTIKIYETSLIPQAQSSYNSSKSAYRASTVSFLDLLESERALYQVKNGFFKVLNQYVEDLTELEAELGVEVSNFDKILQKEE